MSSELAPRDVDLLVVLPENFSENEERLLTQKRFEFMYSKIRLHIFAYKEHSQSRDVAKYFSLFQRMKYEPELPKGLLELEI